MFQSTNMVVCLKKIIQRTSNKIFAKLGTGTNAKRLAVADDLSRSLQPRNTKSRTLKGLKKDASIPEALLIAARNNLPPVQFHHIHGPQAQLSKQKNVARRTKGFCQALVFSNRVILPNERVYIKVLDIENVWSGTIRFGFTSVDPATLRYQMPKHACPDMTNAGHTWARALADEVVVKNSVIHFSYDTNGFIHYGINNQDCGIFYANVSTNQNLWFIIDIYGLTKAVELIDPRAHSNSSSSISDDSRLSNNIMSSTDDDEPFTDLSRSTMFKSASNMQEIIAHYNIIARREGKKRKKATRHSTPILDPWVQENILMANGIQTGRPVLPDLSPILVTGAQQNIYSPMPSILRNNTVTILNNSNTVVESDAATTNRQPSHSQQQSELLHNSSVNQENLGPSATAALSPYVATAIGQSGGHNYYQLIATSPLQQQQTTNAATVQTQHYQQLQHQQQQSKNRVKVITTNNENRTSVKGATTTQIQNQQQQQIQSKTDSKSTTTSSRKPGPVEMVGQQINSLKLTSQKQLRQQQSVFRRKKLCPAQAASRHSLSTSGLIAENPERPSSKAKHQVVQQASLAPVSLKQSRTSTKSSKDNGDKTNSTPDCPICFERPVDCVLYQCGHMCTCYECGVKQWRTQSRSCPICRTVIKDVIKTYRA